MIAVMRMYHPSRDLHTVFISLRLTASLMLKQTGECKLTDFYIAEITSISIS